MLEKLKNKKLNKKGFTLAELLVVIAIIAVLVAVAIPVFKGALDKAKEATDLANVRATYAELLVTAMTSEDYIKGGTITINLSDLKGAAKNGSDVSYENNTITVGSAGSFSTDTDVVINTGAAGGGGT